MSEQQESESRSRSVTTPASCAGKACPSELEESRLCHGSNTQNGQGNRKSTTTGGITISISISGGVVFVIICICCWKCGVCE
ncbi:uncharacterized protein LOC141882215 [Acropora palmata]|uniref:uncharacterized protein LOC141882215 n=1 Tax=Acropora palmata TaxID=6131 RepID=UPI003DA10002